jgi:hypothetical protein
LQVAGRRHLREPALEEKPVVQLKIKFLLIWNGYYPLYMVSKAHFPKKPHL